MIWGPWFDNATPTPGTYIQVVCRHTPNGKFSSRRQRFEGLFLELDENNIAKMIPDPTDKEEWMAICWRAGYPPEKEIKLQVKKEHKS